MFDAAHQLLLASLLLASLADPAAVALCMDQLPMQQQLVLQSRLKQLPGAIATVSAKDVAKVTSELLPATHPVQFVCAAPAEAAVVLITAATAAAWPAAASCCWLLPRNFAVAMHICP